MDISRLDLTDNQQLEEVNKTVSEADRQALIEALALDLKISLPDKLEGKAKTVEGRLNTIRQIASLNRMLDTPPIDVGTLKDRPLIDRNWLLYPLLPSAEVTLCTGQGGFGKSYLLLQIACLLTAGFNDGALTKSEIRSMTPYHYFLQPHIKDLNYTEPSPVVYASYEDNLDEINRRIHYIFCRFAFAKSKQHEILSNFHPVPMRQHGPVWAPALGKHIQTRSQATDAAHQLQKICETQQAKLLIIDPLSAGFYGEENSKAEAYAFINWWAAWGEDTQTAVLISAHLPKSTEARRSGYSGAAAWEGAVRSLFTLDRFDMNEDEDGAREKEKVDNRQVNKPRKLYLAIKGIKGNYAPTAKEEIPLIKGQYGWLEHTGETTLSDARGKAFQAYSDDSKGKVHSSSSKTQEDTQDDDENPYANIRRR